MAETDQHLRLRSDLIVSEQVSGATKYYVVKDPITWRYFRLREPEYFLLRQFDGKTDFSQASTRLEEQFNIKVSPEAVARFARQVDELYFFEGSRAEYEISAGRYKGQRQKSRIGKILFIRLKAFDPEKLLDRLYPYILPFFNPLVVAALSLFIIAGFFTYSANYERFRFDTEGLFTVGSLILIFLSLALIITVHEFGHALTCKHYGGRVREMGFLLLYFQLCFYSNLSDSWLFPQKSRRQAVIWTGLFVQMIIFALTVFGWRVTVIGTAINDFFWLTANLCLLLLLFNINPLLKLDGYYLLSEMVAIPNLRDKSFAYLRRLMLRILGIPVEESHSSPRERRIMSVYMLLAGIYSAGLLIYIAVIVYRFLVGHMAGTGFLLFLLLLAIIFRKPVVSTANFIFSREVIQAMAKPRNYIILAVITVILVIILFFIPFHHQVGGNIVVRPVAEYSISHQTGQGRLDLSLRQSGVSRQFSTESIQLSTGDLAVLRLQPLVGEGDTVVKGDTLAVIISNQVSANLESARAELSRLENELALIQSPPKPEAVETAQATVNAAQATVRQLENDLERSKSLYEKKLIALQELELSESRLEVSRSNLKEAQAKLRLLKSSPKKEEVDILISRIAAQEATIKYFTIQDAAQVITTPINGEVVSLYRDEKLIKVADMSRVEIAIPISDNYLELVKAGAEVKVKVRTYPSDLFAGHVIQISRSAEDFLGGESLARYPIFAILDNGNGVLQDGMSGYAKISCGRTSLFNIIVYRLKALIRVEFWSWW